jgi:hypothetical protein
LGGTLYQRQTQLQLRVIPPLPLPKTTQFSVLGSVNYISYATLEGFDSTTWELRGIWEHKSSRSQEQLSFGYLSDHALGSRPGGDRDGWYGSINTRVRLPHSLTGELSWTEQTWTSSSVYSQGLIDQIRRQNTQIFRGALIYPIAQHQNLTLELRHVRNNENISLFQYSSRQLQLTWQWQNF